jgi:hypothetical protein
MKKRIAFGLVFVFLFFVFAELLARAYYYRKPASSVLASYELVRSVKRSIFNKPKFGPYDNKNHYAARPGLAFADFNVKVTISPYQ